ncbi:TniQ family protein [Paraburkholderia denitrificans]|uniref:TniQ family protein n=1 Tax=Paraburkholderia denitrificans TaxID=694025 RepID=A0ABW0J8Q2_9BURK
MKGLTSSLWPIRYRPQPDELLSSWLVRLAHGHGLKVQTLCNLAFGNRLQVWNRDIDRLAPLWLIDELCLRTDTPFDVAWDTTLRAYEGRLYPTYRASGMLSWILMLNLYHRKRRGFGMQFCPRCLATDLVPYLRKSWRVAFNTVCSLHGNLLADRCPACGESIAIHRISMVRPDALDETSLAYCCSCEFDLRKAPVLSPSVYDAPSSNLLYGLSSALLSGLHDQTVWDLGRFQVMHHICRIMTTRSVRVRLREFAADACGVTDIDLVNGYRNFETRNIEERHHVIQLAAWIMDEPALRLTHAWQAGFIRYSTFLKGFDGTPDWYVRVVKKFSNWRTRPMYDT